MTPRKRSSPAALVSMRLCGHQKYFSFFEKKLLTKNQVREIVIPDRSHHGRDKNQKPKRKMNQSERITNLFAHDFNGNPGGVITDKNNCYTFDQYEPTRTAWLRHEDNIRGSLKITRDAKHGGSNATFTPAHLAA